MARRGGIGGIGSVGSLRVIGVVGRGRSVSVRRRHAEGPQHEEGRVTPYYADEWVTIYHGDCLDVLPLLRADAVVSDPPYGVGVPYGPNYDDSRDDYWPWMRECVEAMRRSASVVAFTHRVAAISELPGWDWVAVWNKGVTFGPRVGNSPLIAGWEPILMYGIHSVGVGGEGLADVQTLRPHKAGNIMDGAMGREKWRKQQLGHPVPKPASLYYRLVSTLSPEGGVVVDPFMGTGTTLRAAKDAGRRAIGIEVEEAYCELAVAGLAQETLDLGGVA